MARLFFSRTDTSYTSFSYNIQRAQLEKGNAKLVEMTDILIEPLEIDSQWTAMEVISAIAKHHKIPEILVKALLELNRKILMQQQQGLIANEGNNNVTSKDKEFILNLEDEVIGFIKEPNVDSWKMTPLNSYYRLLTHKLSEYYELGHILSNDGFSMVLYKKNTSLINADENTKRNAQFYQSGNIKPLKFEDLSFDPTEKLNRISLQKIHELYSNAVKSASLKAIENANIDINNGVSNNHNNDLVNSFNNMNFAPRQQKQYKIMKRNGNKNLKLRDNQRQNNNNSNDEDDEYDINTNNEDLNNNNDTDFGFEEGSELTKEEKYEIVKKRLDKEHADEADDDEDEDEEEDDGENNYKTQQQSQNYEVDSVKFSSNNNNGNIKSQKGHYINHKHSNYVKARNGKYHPQQQMRQVPMDYYPPMYAYNYMVPPPNPQIGEQIPQLPQSNDYPPSLNQPFYYVPIMASPPPQQPRNLSSSKSPEDSLDAGANNGDMQHQTSTLPPLPPSSSASNSSVPPQSMYYFYTPGPPSMAPNGPPAYTNPAAVQYMPMMYPSYSMPMNMGRGRGGGNNGRGGRGNGYRRNSGYNSRTNGNNHSNGQSSQPHQDQVQYSPQEEAKKEEQESN